MARARKVAHDLNSAVTVKINELAYPVLISARYLVVCTQEQVQAINCRLLVAPMSEKF
jgi:hypothetical protein